MTMMKKRKKATLIQKTFSTIKMKNLTNKKMFKNYHNQELKSLECGWKKEKLDVL